MGFLMASLLIIVIMLAAMLTPDGFRSSLTAFQKKTSNIAPLTATINTVSGAGDFEENARQKLTPEFFMEIGALKAAAKVADAEAAAKVANAEAATKVANAEAATKVALVKLAAAEAAAASEIRHLTEISLSMRGALNMRTVLESEMNTVFFEVANELEIKKYRTMTEKCRLIGEHATKVPISSPALRNLKALAAKCGYPLSELPVLYSHLSNEVHGASWSGPGILSKLSALPDERMRCFMRKLAATKGLDVHEVQS